MCDEQKRIEEIINEIGRIINDSMYYLLDEDDSRYLAEGLYEQGYRKQSEVVDEFVERIKERLFTIPTVYNAHFGRMVDAIAKEMKGE
jgi:uncharacterized protein YukJ